MRMRATACVIACLALVAAAPTPSLAHPRARAAAARPLRLGSRVLKIGMSGTDVFHLQVLLTWRGFPVTTDRVFGPLTQAAVERAQRAYGLVVDGIVGPATLGALRGGGPTACSSAPGAGTPITRWTPVVSCVLGLLRQPRTQAYINDVLIVIAGESGGNPAAINLWDVNAQRGDPSRGLMQVIGTVFARYHDPALRNDIYDPTANIYAGLAYAVATYGSIPNIPGVKAVAAGRHYVGYRRRNP